MAFSGQDGGIAYICGGRRCYSEEYSEVAGKQGQALGAKSWWPWMEAWGKAQRRVVSRARREARWAAVRVSAGWPLRSRPPM